MSRVDPCCNCTHYILESKTIWIASQKCTLLEESLLVLFMIDIVYILSTVTLNSRLMVSCIMCFRVSEF